MEADLKGLWTSNGERKKVPRFKCAFCEKIVCGDSYSIVDGAKSCKECDSQDGTFIDILKNSKPLPREVLRLINENFWDLV